MEKYRIEKENERFKRRDMAFIVFPVKSNCVGTHSHIHEAIEILYITEGSFEISCDNKTVRAEVGDLLLFRSNSIHRTVAGDSEKNSYLVLKISPRLIIKFLPNNRSADSLLWLSVNHDAAKFHWRADEIEGSEIGEGFSKLVKGYSSEDENAEFAMRIAAATVILGLLRHNDGQSDTRNTAVAELVYKAIVYINENYAEDVSAETLSERLGISYSYFSRSFKRIAGKSFREYLNNTRINHGEELLLNTNKSVTEIASLCGFANLSYFIARYRKYKGVSPLAARKGTAETRFILGR